MAANNQEMEMPYVYRTQSFGIADQQLVLNHIDWSPDSGETVIATGTLSLMLTEWALRWSSLILPRLHISYKIDKYVVQEIIGVSYDIVGAFHVNISPMIDRAIQNQPTTVQEGSKTTDPLPTSVAVGAFKHTANFSRYYRGGMRFGPIVEADSVYNELLTSERTAWSTALASLRAPIVVGAAPAVTFTAGVWSGNRASFGVGTDAVNLYHQPLTGISVSPLLTTQVSRRPRAH